MACLSEKTKGGRPKGKGTGKYKGRAARGGKAYRSTGATASREIENIRKRELAFKKAFKAGKIKVKRGRGIKIV